VAPQLSSGIQLLERERELSSLEALVGDASGGVARVAVIEGAAGIGKTRLLAALRVRAAEAGLGVLAARGGEFEREFPFGVVRQLLEPALVEDEARRRLLAGAAAPAEIVFDAAVAPLAPARDSSFAILHGLFWLTVNLAGERPLLLAVDDLHWCDHPSLRYLAYLVRRLEGLPVLVACTLRPSEPGVDAALVGEVVGDPSSVAVHPRPLSEAAVAELVAERLGGGVDAAFAGACHAATGGNPLLLGELLKTLETEGVEPDSGRVAVVAELGPRAASRAVLMRLGRLPAETAEVARAVAILGDGADVSTVAALAELDEERAGSAVAALVRAEILRPEPPLGFVHPLVADAVYRDVPPGDRELRHARAARLLAALEAPAERVAAHLLHVPPAGEAWRVATLREAATLASRKGAAENAVSFLTRALEEPPARAERSGVMLDLGLAEALTRGPAAVEHLQTAYEGISAPELRGEVARVLALTLLQTGSRDAAAAVAGEAAAALPAELDDLRLHLKAFEAATVLFGVRPPPGVLRLEEHRVPDRHASTGEKLCMGLAATRWPHDGGTAEQCAELALAALAGGDVIAAETGFLALAPINALVVADRPEAVDAFDAAFATAHSSGSLYSISSVRLWRGYALYRRGELVEATEDLELADEEFESWGFAALARTYLSAFLGLALTERGDLEAARAALARGVDNGLVADGIRYWLNARLELLVAEGRSDEALAAADELRSRFGELSSPAFGPWRSLAAQALDRLGRRDEALAVAEEELALSSHWGGPWALGRSLRVLGTLERDEGMPRLAQAVDVLDGSTARLELAKALAALGSALRRSRRPADSREPLRRALELADVCGASGLAEHVRSELYAAGARPRTTALQGVEALTASERRVAALAAGGHTNRDIAQALFVTPKTVEVHLSSAYRKLGIGSRRQLARALEPA
jgi:DNA-binding CsgD family transcriptional regulator/tetratricopeptide (TPR) repeat protein